MTATDEPILSCGAGPGEWQRVERLAAHKNARVEGSVEMYGPVDILSGRVRSMFSAGCDGATAGHYFNLRFPANFYALLLSHRGVYTNAVGSHVVYAVDAGQDVRWSGVSHEYVNLGDMQAVWEAMLRERPIETAVAEALPAGPSRRTELEQFCAGTQSRHPRGRSSTNRPRLHGEPAPVRRQETCGDLLALEFQPARNRGTAIAARRVKAALDTTYPRGR